MIISLCVSICKTDPVTDYCYGCARTNEEKKIWKDFRENSKTEMIFLHRDEFQKQYKSKWLQKVDFPVILVSINEGLEVFISSEELKELKTPESLIELITERLNRN